MSPVATLIDHPGGHVAGGAFSYVMPNLVGNTSYTYQIRARNQGGLSAASNQATDVTYPSALTALTATAISTTEVDLTWQDSNGAGNGYSIMVERQVGSGSWTAPTPITATSPYRDTGCVPNTTYSYRLTAHNSTHQSSPAVSNNALTVNRREKMIQ